MADKDVPYTAEWTQNLKHRPDPNRIETVQISTEHADRSLPTPAKQNLAQSSTTEITREPHPFSQGPPGSGNEPSYYDIPLLAAPLWKYEIAAYFFLGGLSAGAYVLARVAERAGGEEFRDVTRAGTWVSLAALIPCPPLLIHDLGDPKRFHHMLRVFKPSSPMSLGTWALVGFSGMVAAACVREVLRYKGASPDQSASHPHRGKFQAWLAIHDFVGIPFALSVAGYTGVLLSCTANPMWVKNPWIGPLFSASAMGAGAAATSLAMDLTSKKNDSPGHRALEKIDSASRLAEAVTMAGYLRHAGEGAKPLISGKQKKHMIFAIAGLIGGEAIKHLPLEGKAKKQARMFSSVLTLAAGFSLRWAFIYGGHEAGLDPRLSRLASKPKPARLTAPRKSTGQSILRAVVAEIAKTYPPRTRVAKPAARFF